MATPQFNIKKGRMKPWPEEVLKINAKMQDRLVNDICCICLIPIELMIFRNSGVCCELHRKARDNDFGVARNAVG